MVPNEEESMNILDDHFITKNFLFIFPLKWSAYFFLWLYTFFFGFLMTHTAIELFEAGFNFFSIANYYTGFKLHLSFICFSMFVTSLTHQRAIRGAFGSICFFTLLCSCQVLFKVGKIWFTESEMILPKVPEIFLETMNDFFESVENRSMKYFCYFVFTVTVILGWHIMAVIISFHRETWIRINPALEGNVADLHIESITAPKPSSSVTSRQKKTKANKKFGKRR